MTILSEPKSEEEYLDKAPDDVEMSIFDHLEELRWRIFYSLIAGVLGIVLCFFAVKPLVQLLEIPAQGIKFLQLSPGEYFFVTLKVAGLNMFIYKSLDLPLAPSDLTPTLSKKRGSIRRRKQEEYFFGTSD